MVDLSLGDKVAPSKGIQLKQSWILESILWIPGSREWILVSLSVKVVFRILISSGIPDSLSCIPDSRCQDS